MSKKYPTPKEVVIPCEMKTEVRERIEQYSEDLRSSAHEIGSHGMSKQEFHDSGLFRAAIERLRGQQAASMQTKKDFVKDVLDFMVAGGFIRSWEFTGAGDRHDYQVELNDGRISIFESKGSLDGNNTTIYQRPPNADEFIVWGISQNPGSDPKHNAWSGIHTRIGAKIIAEKEVVDGIVLWDIMCGTASKSCPKVEGSPERYTPITETRKVTPPCLYLLPRTVPDPRSNHAPPTATLENVGFLKALFDAFKCDFDDVMQVAIEARRNGNDIQRKTVLKRDEVVLSESKWTTIKRVT